MPETQNPLTTESEPAIMGPLTRWIRTILQVLGALIVAVPTATAAAGVSAMTSAKVVGLMAGVVILVSAIQNTINHKSSTTTKRDKGGIDNGVLVTILVILAIVALLIWLLGYHR